MASPHAGGSSPSGSLGRAFTLLMGLTDHFITICIGNAGVLPPGLCFT